MCLGDIMKKLLLNGEISVNCYIISNQGKCYIIDPGYQVDYVRKLVNENNLDVEGILLTHGHLDHIGAIDCFDVPVYLYKDELDLVMNDDLNGFNTLGVSNRLDMSKINFVPIDEDYELYLGDKRIEIIFTPGHTKGGVCYKYENDLFTGDTLFKNAVGRSDFPSGNIEELKKSVVKIIDMFDGDVNVHPGHMGSSTIAEERIQNSYYKMWKK